MVSDINFFLLGELVQRVSETPLESFVKREIYDPLGMKDTALGLRADLAARRVPVVVRDRSPGLFVPELLEAMNNG